MLFCINQATIVAQVKPTPFSEKFTEGNYLLLEENYLKALENFLAAFKIDSSSSNVNFKIGYCYLKTESDKKLSLRYLAKAVKNTTKHYNEDAKDEKIAPVNAYFYYGQALHLNYRFDEAIANYEKFKSYLDPSKNADLIKETDRMIQISKNAKVLVAAPITSQIMTNMGDSINSPYPDYSAVVSADENTIIFTSRRPGSTGGDLTDDGQFYEDIYVSYKKKDGTWTSPKSISPNINTNEHDASVGLIADGQTLLMYKESNGGDIYSSTLQGNTWSFPQPMGGDINSESWETSACLSPDGNTIYFVSNRPGGLGKRDIWTCNKLPNGQWSKATNMGAPINTEYDEESPFIHPNGEILFFSSTGHNTMGGFDIFYSEKNDKGWGEPQNMGYPINTTDDDLYYISSPDGKRGYYTSSLKEGGFGEKDIWQISLVEKKEQALVVIKGVIIPAPGDPMPADIEIITTDQESGLVGRTVPLLRDGTFIIIIPPNSKKTLSYQQAGEEFETEEIIVPSDSPYKEINKVIHLKPSKKGQPLAIDHNPNADAATHPTTDTNPDKENNDAASKKGKSPCGNNVSKEAMVSSEGFVYDKDGKPLANTRVDILNSKGEVIKTATTKSTGGFIFTQLCPDEDYNLVTDDPSLALGPKSVMHIRDNKKSIIKTIHLGKNGDITKGNKPKHDQVTVLDKLNFEMHYIYNNTEIDVHESSFVKYVDNIVALCNKNGNVTIEINSSASKVPTKTFGTNEALAKSRSTKIKEQLLTALKAKGIDESKIKFNSVNSQVSGPSYNADYLTNKKEYEKYQYSKVKVY